MLVENYITETYCFIDDMMKKCGRNIRQRGPESKLSDTEVITHAMCTFSFRQYPPLTRISGDTIQ